MGQLQCGNSRALKCEHRIPIMNVSIFEVEKYFHKRFKANGMLIRGEWYRLSFDHLEKIKTIKRVDSDNFKQVIDNHFKQGKKLY